MKEKLFFLIIFVFLLNCLLGQEKFTIRGEFPDNTLDGKYVLLIDKSYLLEEREGQKQAYDNSIKIKVIGKEFFYEGTVTRKPYFAQISYDGSSFHKETDINLLWNLGISIFVWSIGILTLMYRALPSMKITILTFLSEKLNGVLYIGIEIGEKWRKIVLKQRIVTY